MKTYKCKDCKEVVPHTFCIIPNEDGRMVRKYSCPNCGRTEERSKWIKPRYEGI